MLARMKILSDEHLRALGPALRRAGLTPNRLSIIGLILAAMGAWLLYDERIYPAVAIIAFGIAADALDGLVARTTGQASLRGGFLDAMVDRSSEIMIFGALLLGGWLEPLRWEGWDTGPIANVSGEAWALGALSGALLTSYTRAAAERLGVNQEGVGMIERPERMGILGVGVLIGQPTAALALLAILGHVTVLQRVAHFWRNAPPGPTSNRRP